MGGSTTLPDKCMVAVAAACRKTLVNDGWAICLLSSTNGCRKCSFHLVGKIGSALAERVGQGEMGGCTALLGSAWRRLQLPVEKPWSMPGGPFVCILAQMGLENAPFTL